MEKATTKKKDVAATKAVDTTPSQEVKRKPEKAFYIEDCGASVWSREYVVQGTPRVFRTVTFERSYKDRNGQFRYTKSFDQDSLGKVVRLCQMVEEYLMNAEQEAQ